MKYKRQLMTTVFALSFLAASPSAFAVEDFVANSKVSQYESQLQMKSFVKDNDNLVKNKKHTTKKYRRSKKLMNHLR